MVSEPPHSAARREIDKLSPLDRLHLAAGIILDEIERQQPKKSDDGTDGLIED